MCIREPVEVRLLEQDGSWKLQTNLFAHLSASVCALITSHTLGCAFEPEQPFEDPDGTPICFDTDYNGEKRTGTVFPGPFAVPGQVVQL